MSDVAIRVENLSKFYHIGAAQKRHDTLRDAIGDWRLEIRDWMKGFARPTSNIQPPTSDSIWALKDVSFEVKRGEVIGIIGRNGAGKSTLLKILSRITEPTRGRAILNGGVGSLLEVGTGFHPELTGRENIYLNGAILGMKRAEIDRQFDEIVAFAEIEKFLDTPVKRYSSGMYVRLAFAVAAHLEPEILLVDEVLAVGDAAFQKKCLGKMGDVAKEGRTVLFVSHNLIALQSLCPRALWLDQGILKEEGTASEVVSAYLQLGAAQVHEQAWGELTSAPGNGIVRLHRVWIEPSEGSDGLLAREMPITIGVEYWNATAAQIHITLHVYVEQQVVAFTTASSQDPGWQNKAQQKGLFRNVCQIPAYFLNTGQHRINLLVVQDRSKVVYELRDALAFDVVETERRPGAWHGREPGVVRPMLPWNTEYLGDQQVKSSDCFQS